MADLSGRVVVIVNADTEDGARAARAIAADGAGLVLAGRDGSRLGALAAELIDAYRTRVATYVGNPSNDEDRAALSEMIGELFVT